MIFKFDFFVQDPLTGDVKVGAENWPDTMAIYRHFQEVHAKPSDLTFKCELCEKSFLTQGMLSSHKAHHLKVSKIGHLL